MDSMANFLTPHKVVLGTLTRCYVDRQAIDAGDPSTVDLALYLVEEVKVRAKTRYHKYTVQGVWRRAPRSRDK